MRSGTPQYLFDTPRFLFARQQGGCFGRIGEICGGIGAGFCRRRGGRRRICRTGGRIGSGGGRGGFGGGGGFGRRSEEHTSELQSLMRISYAVFCLKKKKDNTGYASQTDTSK